MSEDNPVRSLRAGLSSDDGAASVSALRASIPIAGKIEHIKYLEEHHHITESMLGVLLLCATSEQKEAVRGYADQLDLLHINRLLDQGVPPENIGEREMFVLPDRLVAQAIEARSGETGTGSIGAADESAVPSGMRPDIVASPNPRDDGEK